MSLEQTMTEPVPTPLAAARSGNELAAWVDREQRVELDRAFNGWPRWDE